MSFVKLSKRHDLLLVTDEDRSNKILQFSFDNGGCQHGAKVTGPQITLLLKKKRENVRTNYMNIHNAPEVTQDPPLNHVCHMQNATRSVYNHFILKLCMSYISSGSSGTAATM